MLGQYGRMYTFETSFDGKTQVLVLKHGRGPRTSAYLAHVIGRLFKRLGIEPEITETEDQVSIKVKTPFKARGTELVLSKRKY